jgi:hypothetical protein
MAKATGFLKNMLIDNGGHPTESTLQKIEKWSVKDDVFTLMSYVQPLFEGYGKCEYNPDKESWIVSTGGWSGCEDVIMSLQKNHLFWSLCWMLSKRGGHYEFLGNAPTGDNCES